MKSLYSYITEKCDCKKKSCNKVCARKTVDALEKITNKEDVTEAKKETVTLTGEDSVGNVVVSVDCAFSDAEIQKAMKKFNCDIMKDCYHVLVHGVRKELPSKASKLRVGLMNCQKHHNDTKGLEFVSDEVKALLVAEDPTSTTCDNFFVFLPKKYVKTSSSALAAKTIPYSVKKTFENVVKKLK